MADPRTRVESVPSQSNGRFGFTHANVTRLAQLVDKYDIQSLGKDIKVYT